MSSSLQVGSRNLLTSLRSRWETIRGPNFRILPSDVFLVSYPRSGNSWVRFLLANAFHFEAKTPVDFHSVQNIIPDSHIEEQRRHAARLSPPRIIKSHRPFTPAFPRTIYIVRDGRDACVSYFDFLSRQARFEGTFSDFLLTRDLPYGTWHEHVQSWLESKHEDDFLLVRYEDLLEDAGQELERMLRFVGLAVSTEQLSYAVNASSLTQMRKIEEAKGRPFGDHTYHFVRRGTARRWKDQFNEKSKAIFKSCANHLLLELGYVDSEDW